MKSNFNVQFATQRLREEEETKPKEITNDTRRFIMSVRDLDTEIEKSKYRGKLFTLTNNLRSAQDSKSALEILNKIKDIIELDDSIDRVSKANTLNLIQKINSLFPESSIGEQSVTGGEGAYLTKAGSKRETPKPTSGYKDVKGFRPGHSKLKVVEPKDLWNLNEVGVKEKPEKAINYPNGEKIELGDRVKIDNKLEGVINGFAFNDEEQKETIFINVDKGGGSSSIRPNMPFFQNQLELIKKAPVKQINPSDSETEEPLQEGIKQSIKSRNKSEQFYEAAKQANKKLEEVNKILEYAAELKRELKENEGIVESTNSILMMEKARKRMVSAYAKMKKLEEESEGLWANIRAKRARGEKPAKKGSKAYNSAVKAAKEINKNS